MGNKQYLIKTIHLKNCSIQIPNSLSRLLENHKKPNELVFELSLQNKHYNFCWNGITTKNIGEQEIIIMDTTLAEVFDIKKDSMAKIKVKSKPHKAKSVEVVPNSYEDWQVLQLNAGFLEMEMLNQCRVVNLNQLIPLWVRGNTKILVKVVNINPTNEYALLQESSEIYVQPVEKAEEQEKEDKNMFSFPSKVLRVISNHQIQNKLLNEFTIKVNPNSILTIEQLNYYDILNQPFPTTGKLSTVIKNSEFIEEENKKDNKTPINNDNKVKNIYLNCIVVNIDWDITIPIYHVVVSDQLALNLNLILFSRVIISFDDVNLVNLRQLKIRAIFPDLNSSDNKKKKEHFNPLNKSNTTTLSWISHSFKVLEWLKHHTQNDNNDLILTHKQILQLNNSNQQPILIQIDLGVYENENLCYSKMNIKEWINLMLIEDANSIFINHLHIKKDIKLIKDLLHTNQKLGSFDKLINDLFGLLRCSTNHVLNSLNLNNNGSVALLICGAKGSGKTSLLKEIKQRVGLDIKTLIKGISLDCHNLVNERVSIVIEKIKTIFYEAAFYSPSLIVLDNLDTLIMAEMEHMDSFRYRQLAEFLAGFILYFRKAFPKVSIIASCLQQHSVHELLLQSHAFTHTINIQPPNKNERNQILEAIMSSSKIEVVKDSLKSIDLLDISSNTEGYLPADLVALTERAVHHSLIRQLNDKNNNKINNITNEDFKVAQLDYTPVSLRGVKLQSSDVSWSDIGGLEETRRILRETLEWPIKYQAIFQSCPLRLRSGLLLYGFPGCGKTMLASAVAKECHLNFITVKGPEILNKYIGASEQSVRDLFQRAQAAKPCVLFFDEFEAIAPRRGHDSTGVTDRVVNQLLTQMDGAEGLEGVYVLAATSRPDLIDPALLRPGRLDKSLLCHLPTVDDRYHILKAHASKFDLDDDSQNQLKKLAEQTIDFTGADLQALLYNAHLEAIHDKLEDKSNHINNVEDSTSYLVEDIKVLQLNDNNKSNLTSAEMDKLKLRVNSIFNKTKRNNSSTINENHNTMEKKETILITWNHILKALENTNTSLPASEIFRLQNIYDEFQFGKAGDPKKIGKKSTLG